MTLRLRPRPAIPGVFFALMLFGRAIASASAKAPECGALPDSTEGIPGWYAERCLPATVKPTVETSLAPKVSLGPILVQEVSTNTVRSTSVAGIATLTSFGAVVLPQTDFPADFVRLPTDTQRVYQITSQGAVSRYTTAGANTALAPIAPAAGSIWSDTATDPTTGVVYGAAIVGSCASSTLSTLDMTGGSSSPVGPITSGGCIISLAADNTGILYGIDLLGDNLIRINKATGAGTVVGPIGFNASLGQAMDCDPASGTCYMFTINDTVATDTAELRAVNTVTGATTLVGTIGSTSPGGLPQVPGAVFATITCTDDAGCSDGNPCTGVETCTAGTCAAGAPPPTVEFCNTGSITILASGAANPYPSTIAVSGIGNSAALCSVKLQGIAHTWPGDIDILLVGPVATTQNAEILSDVATENFPVTNVNLTLKDSAAASLPTTGPLVSGTFKPTNVGATADVFPAPAPTANVASSLTVFSGNPNGAWRLFVADDFPDDSGSVAQGWCVNLVPTGCTTSADCDDGNPCTDDVCTNLQCTFPNNTAACSDGNACTLNDACSGGVCVSGPPGTDGSACSDNSLCTTPDVCVGGACRGQNPVVCPPDANPCATEACDPATGTCVSNNNDDPCDDGDVCTANDACGPALFENFDGETAPNLPPTWSSVTTGDGDPWVTETVSPDTPPNTAFGPDGPGPSAANVLLISPPIDIVSASAQLTFRNRWSFENVSVCYDAGVLEIDMDGGGFTDIVKAGGSFVSGGYTGTVSTQFESPLAGRSAWCNASAGYPAYVTTVVNLPAAAAGRTIQLQWRIGTDTSLGAIGQDIDSIVLIDGTHRCNPGTPIDCDDSNPCTDDLCDESLGCQHANNTDSCDDGNACTILDACGAGACAGQTITCDDSDPCTLDSCATDAGCQFTPITIPGEVQGVWATSKTKYVWSSTESATRYDVVRGLVSALPVGPGGGDEVCFPNLSSTMINDPAMPAPGTGFWYLSRAENACGMGTYGQQGVRGLPGAPRNTTSCP